MLLGHYSASDSGEGRDLDGGVTRVLPYQLFTLLLYLISLLKTLASSVLIQQGWSVCRRPRRRGPRAPREYTQPACCPIDSCTRESVELQQWVQAIPGTADQAHLCAERSPQHCSWIRRDAGWAGHIPSGHVPLPAGRTGAPCSNCGWSSLA